MSPSQVGIEAQDYEQHAAWLRSLARSLVSDPSTADDIAQETWLSALRHGPGRQEPLRPWLTRVAQNAARKLYRTEGRRKNREQLAAPIEEPLMSAAELAESADLIHTLMGEVRELSEPYRSTVLQAYLQGMTSKEIAQQTGAPEGTVRWRLSAARDELRERMDQKVGSREGWAILAAPMGFTTRLAATKAVTAAATRTGFSFGWLLPMAAFACLLGVLVTLRNLPSVGAAPGTPVSSIDPLAGAEELAAASPKPMPDRAALGVEAPTPATSKPAATQVALDPGQAALHVRVEDAEGEPVRGVTFTWPGNRNVRQRTNEDGVATLLFRPPASGTGVELLLERSGFVTQAYTARPVAGETSYLGTVLLEKALDRRGRVLFADGTPARNASVFAAPAPSGALADSSEQRVRTAPPAWPGVSIEAVRSSSDGTFELEGLPNQPMQLWAVSEGTWYSSSEVVSPDSHQPVEIVLQRLPEDEAVAGTVFDMDGKPAADVLVRLRPLGSASPGARPLERVTDADGHFRFQPRGLGSFEVLAEDLLDRWADTEWQPVEKGEASLALRFTSEL